jgi:hypothetical protein
MNSIKFVVLCVVAILGLGFTTRASAQTQTVTTWTPAMNGVDPADKTNSCFNQWYTSMQNNCPATRTFDLPYTRISSILLTGPAVGVFSNATFTFNAFGATSSNVVACQGISVDAGVTTLKTTGGFVQQATFGSSQSVTVGTISGIYDIDYLTCSITQGGRINVASAQFKN